MADGEFQMKVLELLQAQEAQNQGLSRRLGDLEQGILSVREDVRSVKEDVGSVKEDTVHIRKEMMTDRSFADNYVVYIRELEERVSGLSDRVDRLEQRPA